MDLEIIILSEVSQRKTSYDVTYLWNLKIQMKTFSATLNQSLNRFQLQLPTKKYGYNIYLPNTDVTKIKYYDI